MQWKDGDLNGEGEEKRQSGPKHRASGKGPVREKNLKGDKVETTGARIENTRWQQAVEQRE